MNRRVLLVAALALACLGAVSAASGAGGPLVRLGDAPMSPGLAADLQKLPAVTPYGAFVHFSSGTPEQHRTLLEDHGLVVTADFESTARAVFAVGTVGDVRGLTREPSVEYLEENRKLKYFGDTAVWASRSRVAQEAVSGGPYLDGGGDVLTGDGVGVAIVDSGINATHPDLTNRVGKNFKIVCTTPGLINTTTGQCFGPLAFVDVGNTVNSDTTSGHGTHVSGIVAGDGTQSTGPYPVPAAAPNVRGTFTGVAPRATLHGFSTGEVIVVLYAAEAWQYIFDHYDEFEPRIKVINNSFGEDGGGSYDPNSIDAKLVKALVEQKGVTFTFSSGNNSGTGSADVTSSYCDDPTPGVICVANYDDSSAGTSPTGTGNRDFALNASSSRGNAANPGHLARHLGARHLLHGGVRPGRAARLRDRDRQRGPLGPLVRQHLGHVDGLAAHGGHRGADAPGASGPDAGRDREHAARHGPQVHGRSGVRARSAEPRSDVLLRQGRRPRRCSGRARCPRRRPRRRRRRRWFR